MQPSSGIGLGSLGARCSKSIRYPDAAGTIEKTTGLPPFALAARGDDEEEKIKKIKDREAQEKEQTWSDRLMFGDFLLREPECHLLSSSYFLLRQNPDILTGCINIGGLKFEASPPPKRQCK